MRNPTAWEIKVQVKLTGIQWLFNDCEVAAKVGGLVSVSFDTDTYHLLIEGTKGAIAAFSEGFTYGGGIDHYEFGCLINGEACHLVVFERQGKTRVNYDGLIRKEEWLRQWEANHSEIDIEELRKRSFGTVGFAWDVKEFIGCNHPVDASDFQYCLKRFESFRQHLAESRPSSAWWFYRMTDDEFKSFLTYSWEKCL